VGVKTGKMLGRKIGSCFATTGFLLQKRENVLTKIAGGFVQRRTSKAIDEQINKLVAETPQVTELGPGFERFIRELAQELGPMIGRKVTQCILGPDQPSYQLPGEFKINDLLGVLPAGREYEKVYTDFGRQIGIQIGNIAAVQMKDFITTGEAVEAGGMLGAEVGKCIAVYGWKTETKTNWLIDLLKPFLDDTPNIIATQAGPKVDEMLGKYQLGPLAGQLKPIAINLMQQFGPYLAERITQCLLLPQDDFSRNASEADFDSVLADYDSASNGTQMMKPIEHMKSRRHHNKHHPKQHGINVNVHVSA